MYRYPPHTYTQLLLKLSMGSSQMSHDPGTISTFSNSKRVAGTISLIQTQSWGLKSRQGFLLHDFLSLLWGSWALPRL